MLFFERKQMRTAIFIFTCVTNALLNAQASHSIVINQRTLTPDEGLLLGNGDLSVSVYQTADAIIWRFGKGDVWDRRHDLSEDPKPAHIKEIEHGVEVEGWKCPPYGGKVVATKSPPSDPQRMWEICQGSPPSYKNFPYPCPKPVGELALHFPPDLPGMTIKQELVIEEAKVLIECAWPSGVRLYAEAFIPPDDNVLALRWRLDNWGEHTRMGNARPVWFSLYRWADPPAPVFAEKQFLSCRHGTAKQNWTSEKITPLSPPCVTNAAGVWSVLQAFYPDPLFKNGFSYQMAPFVSTNTNIEPLKLPTSRDACIHLLPELSAHEGLITVAITTSSDRDGPQEEIKRIKQTIGQDLNAAFRRWASSNRVSASNFWASSSVAIEDPLLESLWYETYHARRCAYRGGTVTPGLFLPSTVRDYSHWHGDYHTNYNLQSPFWGDYTANHIEIAEAYFEAINFFLPIGRKIARDYYNCRGVFIQLFGFPILAENDPCGIVPMGRMAYMTGWAMTQYWWRYLYTLDKQWLKTIGYPVIRDCALFYLDFLKKGEDGLYHAFPSNMEEYGFTGNVKDLTDRYQVMRHMRYALRAAIQASEALGVDEELRAQWQDRLDHAAGDEGHPPVTAIGLEKVCLESNSPEFGIGRPYKPQIGMNGQAPAVELGWYFGQTPRSMMRKLREGSFVTNRDFPVYRKKIEAWRRPNGLVWGMAVANYGRCGAWTESLGVCAPLQEMMLQSWDGALRVFPAWPQDVAARFDHFRAEGAFLVSAAWADGQVKTLSIRSEKGAVCRLYPPSSKGVLVTDASDQAVPVTQDTYGRTEFPTLPGAEYRITCLY